MRVRSTIASLLLAAAWAGAALAQQPANAVPDLAGLHAAEPGRLQRELAGIRPGVPGRTELFAVLAAWFPHQGVFLREVDQAAGILADRFDARGRVVTLANSDANPMAHPLATPGNLAAAIDAVAAKMNPGEDVLMVYLTSHGAPGVLAGGERASGVPALTAAELDRILDRAGAPVVAVVSACKSGSFVPALQGPDRLVITAAAADRNSFGCSDANQWTWFGKAFFDEALRQTRSLPAAFGRAAALVASWEKKGRQAPSQPQMAQGERIVGALEKLARDAGG